MSKPVHTINGVPHTPIHTIDQAMSRNEAQGLNFFSRSTLRWWRSRVSSTVYPVTRTGGLYFVTSERREDYAPRLYTVRYMSPDGWTHQASEFQQYSSSTGAHAAASRLRTSAESVSNPRRPHDVPCLLDRGSEDYRTHFGMIEVGP